jgi:hypothetical protein
MTPDYTLLLKDYPKIMSLEQMRVVCHISKRTARRLLLSGLVPCKNTKKKSHTYQIKKSAVLKYLVQRDITPEKYGYRNGSYGLAYENSLQTSCTEAGHESNDAVSNEPPSYTDYPDLLTVAQAAKLAGVTLSAITDWAVKKHLVSFMKGRVRYIPKLSLAEYLQSHRHEFNCEWKKRQFTK